MALQILLLLSVLCKRNVHADKPNIVFILADDFGWANIGYHNKENTEISTPNMDYLANNGLKLNRHYVHYVCSPTRSSVQSGRLPVHCNTNNTPAIGNALNGIPVNYTCIAERIKSDGGYSTHFIGKWDAGSTMKEQLPFGRGYDTSFGYLNHANDYWNKTLYSGPSHCNNQSGIIIDMWNTTHPAYTANNSMVYEEFLFATQVYKHLDEAQQPFFIFYAPHLTHAPNQIPKEYLSTWSNDENECYDRQWPIYPGFNISNPNNFHCRSITQSQVNLLDIIIGNITQKLIDNNQWNNTLIIFSSDNGGPEYLNTAGSNNWPLRGGKISLWEGGIRVNTFVSGGYLPPKRHGEIENGMVHVADWYSTFAAIIGFDPMDKKAKRAGLPPIDSINMWPLLSGENLTSPRTEIAISEHVLIQNNYKYMVNESFDYASWSGYLFPNSSSPSHPIQGTKMDCSKGCLFDLEHDVTEHVNIINENLEIAKKMDQRLIELKKGFYNNNEAGIPLCPTHINMSCQCWAAFNLYQGFYGPSATSS
eukprot:66669_1